MRHIQYQQTSKQTEKTMREIEIFFRQWNSQNEVATGAGRPNTTIVFENDDPNDPNVKLFTLDDL